MKRRIITVVALVLLLTACQDQTANTARPSLTAPSTNTQAAATVTPGVSTGKLSSTLGPVVTPPVPAATFPGDFSQELAAYNSSGPVPQGGPGNVRRYATGAQRFASAPAITADGKLLVLSAGNRVLALQLDSDINKIQEAWRYDPPEATINNYFTVTPLLYNGLAIVPDTAGNLHAIRLGDGKAAWVNRDPLRLSIAAPPVTDGTNLYFTARTNEAPTGMFGPAGGHLYALRLQDGGLAWQSQMIYGAGGRIIFGFDGNLLFGAWDTQLYAYTRSGQPVPGWPDPQVGIMASGPTAPDKFSYALDRIFVGSASVYALDRTGRTVDRTANYRDNGIPAVVGDTVYIGSVVSQPPVFQEMFEVRALNALNLKEVRWVFHTDFPGVASLTVVDGYVYFGAAERFFQVKAGGSGQNRQLFLAGASFSYGNTALVSGGRVYVTNPDGNLYIVK